MSSVLCRPLPVGATYWGLSAFGLLVVAFGVWNHDPYVFATGLWGILMTEVWLIRKRIEAGRG